MNPSLTSLLEKTHSRSDDERSEAVFQIAMLLEKNTRPSDELGYYESVLSPELLNLELGKATQKQFLQSLSKSDPPLQELPSVLWAIGKAYPEAGAASLVLLVHKYRDSLTNEAAYQALIAIENFFDGARDEFADVRRVLTGDQFQTFLEYIFSMEDPKVLAQGKRINVLLRKYGLTK